MNKVDFNFLQQSLGYKYLPGSLLFDNALAPYLNPIDTAFYDWGHMLLMSGGVAQYEVNSYICVLLQSGQLESLAALDRFRCLIVWPHRTPGVTKDFFQWHYSEKLGSHFKAYASETWLAVNTLIMYTNLVVDPIGALPQHVQCIRLLFKTLSILYLGNRALGFVDVLAETIEQHFFLYTELYPEAVIPKLHLLSHVPIMLQEHGCNISTFPMERKHKAVKRRLGICAFPTIADCE